MITTWTFLGVAACLVLLMRRAVPSYAAEMPHEPTPRLRINTERWNTVHPCSVCGIQTHRIVVVRLLDATTRVCGDCAEILAPEAAA